MSKTPTVQTEKPANKPAQTPAFRALLRQPVQFLAFGFGSGLSPKAPGTAGSVVAVVLFLAIAELSLVQYSVVLIAAMLAGIWICDTASKQLNTHDHPGIVWDEFVGYWITMWALPTHWAWIAAGFVLFRILDILKPWPISILDKRVGGGVGIMVDDMVAGVFACAILHVAHWLL